MADIFEASKGPRNTGYANGKSVSALLEGQVSAGVTAEQAIGKSAMNKAFWRSGGRIGHRSRACDDGALDNIGKTTTELVELELK